MKKNFRIFIITLVVLCATATRVSAQDFYWGPRVGMNISGLTKTSYAKSRVRANFGVHMGYKFNDVVGMQVEGLYSLQGSLFHNSDHTTSLNYIKVPLMVKIYLIGGLNVEAGLGFNWLMYARKQGTASNGEEYSVNIYDQCKTFDLSIPLGLNYQFRRLFDVGVRYDVSMTRVDHNADNRAKNSNWSIHVGFRF